MTVIAETSIEDDLRSQIKAFAANGGSLEILGSGSKRFYGRGGAASAVDVSAHSGVIDYDPAELVITLRAGCKLREVEALLAEHRQMLGFEPPHLGADATIGGMLASGLAGPRRAFAGGIRDFVLGVKLLDGRGHTLQFGGRVIKNVAGFDVSRLMVGSLGTLGIILEASIRVIPMYETETTLAFDHPSAADHIQWVNDLGTKPYPISASLWTAGRSEIRLSGSVPGVQHASRQLGGDSVKTAWESLKEQTHDFFAADETLTRIALPPTSDFTMPSAAQLIEWGGAQRWLSGEVDLDSLRQQVAAIGGTVCAYRGHTDEPAVFQPLPLAMLKLQRSIKSSFDPAGIFNPGRIYAEL